jgi:hypothetical protein
MKSRSRIELKVGVLPAEFEGIYFHTAYLEKVFYRAAFECQVKVTEAEGGRATTWARQRLHAHDAKSVVRYKEMFG